MFFWFTYLLSFFYCIWWHWPATPGNPVKPAIGIVLIFILIGLCGWKAPFGDLVK